MNSRNMLLNYIKREYTQERYEDGQVLTSVNGEKITVKARSRIGKRLLKNMD